LSCHAPPSPRLPVQIHDHDRCNLAGASAEGPNSATRDKHGQRAPGSERERSHRTDYFVEIHRGPGSPLRVSKVHAAPIAAVAAIGEVPARLCGALPVEEKLEVRHGATNLRLAGVGG